ncbi:MAG: TolC family protein [Rickettsiales bacterium]|jgi:outer membrane protein TolC|nr:TolC family protein [Rickettsiales bacterium]
MKKTSLILIAILISFNAGAATVKLGLESAVQKIMDASHDVKKADLNIRKSEAVFNAARANRFPKLSASGTYMNNINVDEPGKPRYIEFPDMPVLNSIGSQIGFIPTAGGFRVPDNIGMVGLDLTQPIYTFGRIGYGLDAARSAIKIAESSAELARREMRVAAVQIYYGAKMAAHIQEIVGQSLLNAKKNQRALTMGAGRANKANLLKISTDVVVKEAQLADAKFNADSAMRMLKIMADIDDDAVVVLVDEIPSKFPKAADSEIYAHPEWDIYQESYNASRASMKSKYAGWMPTLAATASYNYVMMHEAADVWNGQNSKNASVGLAISLPILDGGLARYQATQDAREADRAMQDLDKSKKMRRNDLIEATNKHNYLIENAKTQERALDLARRTYKMSADRFAAGQTSAVELSDVESSLVQLEIALLNTRMQIAIAYETIKKLTGENR